MITYYPKFCYEIIWFNLLTNCDFIDRSRSDSSHNSFFSKTDKESRLIEPCFWSVIFYTYADWTEWSVQDM